MYRADANNPKSWHTYLGYVLWALREVPNKTTGVPPWMMVCGRDYLENLWLFSKKTGVV